MSPETLLRRRKQNNTYQQARRLKWKALGVCVDCHREFAGEGHVVGPACRLKRIQREEIRTLRMCRADQPIEMPKSDGLVDYSGNAEILMAKAASIARLKRFAA